MVQMSSFTSSREDGSPLGLGNPSFVLVLLENRYSVDLSRHQQEHTTLSVPNVSRSLVSCHSFLGPPRFPTRGHLYGQGRLRPDQDSRTGDDCPTMVVSWSVASYVPTVWKGTQGV